MTGEAPQSSQSITWQTQRRNPSTPDLRILHFNDVYHIEYQQTFALAMIC